MTYEEAVEKIPVGKYFMHYKGGLYRIIAIAKHSETLEPMVVYTGNGQIWARPASMWFDIIDDSTSLTRFRPFPKEK